MKNSKYLLTLILCFVCAAAFAQQKRISGHVWSKTDGSIMMANVCEIDKNGRIVSATQTDMSGNFSLAIKNPANKLQISYIGYQSKTINPIGAQATFKVELLDKHSLQEAKVTSLRKTKSNGLVIPEREMSTATQTLDMDNMQGLSFETVGEALQGQIAGLDIVANSGNLGAGTSMRLRGTSSITGNQEPLIVVDGYILENQNTSELDLNNMENEEQFATLLQVSPEDIKSIKVLKDAAASAIWGSRGANGVIEITTRRGSRGKTNVNFSYKFSGSWQPQGMKMLNGDGYTMMLKEAYFNPHQSDAASSIVELMYLKDHPTYYGNYSQNTDWVGAVTQFGQTHNYGVNISGGGEKATFRVSGTYDHSKGTIIKQSMDRLTTRLALDYYVSDRIKFTSNFSLTYTKNNKNFYNNILDRAYNAMPNMAIYRQDYDNTNGTWYDSGEYYLMPIAAGAAGLIDDQSGQSSHYLSDMVSNGNPVAIANLSKSVQSTYSITPQFDLEYKLLGKEDDQWQLNYTGSVWMNAYTETNNRYFPSTLAYDDWSSGSNKTSNFEYKNFSFNTRHQLVLKPYFENEDHSLQVMARFDIESNNSTSQNLSSTGINGGITDPTVGGYLDGMSTGTGRGHAAHATGSVHYNYGGRYSVDVTVRADGSTRFGSGRKWGVFPAVSGRWNISDEKFFKPLRKVISMLAIRPGGGIVGNPVGSEGLIYNLYRQSGIYNGVQGLYPSNLRLTEIRWEKKKSWNIGANLNFLDDLIQLDFNVYNDRSTDLLMPNVAIPSSTGYSSISTCNVGELQNQGWDLHISTRPIFKIGKFSAKPWANISQNRNSINEMDANVLNTMNSDFKPATGNEQILSRVQIGNALGGIYGFHFKGVYVYDYDHNGYFDPSTGKNNYYDANGVENTGRYALEEAHYEGVTIYNAAPVARDAQGKVIYDKAGNPLPMMYDYGGQNYQFNGGDVAYEDINHDGQINELDIQYLGSSNPLFNGGFGIDLNYGRWSLKTSFNFRVGNKIINLARMQAENMLHNKNQSAAVNWRWRKNGQVREIPRALNSTQGTSFNSLISDRYVEPGDYLRFQYMQLGYSMDPKLIKKAGFSSVRFTASINNLFVWSKYTGTDPDHTQSRYNPCVDGNQTPRAKSFTAGVTFGF